MASTTTGIEWTETTWNPVRGCRRVSAGCENCYAEKVAVRFSREALSEPLRWRKPRRVFVNSMSDLFFEAFANEQIAAVFGVMAATPQHTYQVLTKRPERAAEWFRWIEWPPYDGDAVDRLVSVAGANGTWTWPEAYPPWPLPNVWLGVSVEDQATADERIPYLKEIPNACPWVSYEPALGPIDFGRIPRALFDRDAAIRRCMNGPAAMNWDQADHAIAHPFVRWIVVGGESGPGARPFDLAWARSTIAQCREAGVACFVKQLGARPRSGGYDRGRGPGRELGRVRDRKGGDWSEWPEALRVREYPRREAGGT